MTGEILADGPFAGLRRRSYACVVCDPPWSFKARTAYNGGQRRDTVRHYPVMDLAAIKALPVGDLVARDSHLFLWTSPPFLPHALEVISAWGFQYSSVAFTWIKLRRGANPDGPFALCDLHTGLGLTTRKGTEICLLARRRNARRIAKDVREVIVAPVREHSRKPAEVFDRVERYCAGPFLELFARERRPNWTSWGAEMDKFSQLETHHGDITQRLRPKDRGGVRQADRDAASGA